jgi:hypothetical protein
MTTPTAPSQSTAIFFDEKGFPVEDRNKAVTAEIVNTTSAGEDEHVLMVKVDPDNEPRGVFDE